MEIISSDIPEVKLIKPTIFKDDRGYFFESFQDKKFKELVCNVDFVQDNESMSKANVIRGLHYQLNPYAQGKLVRVLKGAVVDVAVDIRRNSPTFLKWVAYELSEDNKYQLWIPAGFAHAFISLADNTVFCYKCTNYYNKESERAIIWNDPDINITWDKFKKKDGDLIISEKDKQAVTLKQAEIF